MCFSLRHIQEKIISIDLTEFGGKFKRQKDIFLCATKGVSLEIEFSKKHGRGLFGGIIHHAKIRR